MTEKPKRNNSDANPAGYWWLFGVVAFVLIWYPFRVLPHGWINPILYGLLTVILAITTILFIGFYGWKQEVILILVVCTVLAGKNGVNAIWEMNNCEYEYSEATCDYNSPVTYERIGRTPIGVKLSCHYSYDTRVCMGYHAVLWLPFLAVAYCINFARKHYS